MNDPTWKLVVEGITFSPWELIYLITRCEADLKKRRWSRMESKKELAIRDLVGKLQVLSVGQKPFDIEVRI